MADEIYNGASPDGSGWSQTGNWESGVVPNVGDNVEIAGGPAAMDTYNTQADLNVGTGINVEEITNLQIDSYDGININGTYEETPATLDVTGSLDVDNNAYIDVFAGNSLYFDGSTATGSIYDAGYYYLNGSHSDQTIEVPGTFQLNGVNNDVTVDSGGTTTLAGFNNTVNMDYIVGSLHLIDQDGNINTMNLTASTGLTFDIQDPNSAATTDQYQVSGLSYQFNFTDGSYQSVNFLPSAGQSLSIVDDQDNNDWIVTVVCFASGTLIRTTRGEVAVENLAVGDLVVTAAAEARPIVWLGHRRIERPSREHWPVRVAAGAFADGLPARDLRLSPGHAVCVEVMGEVFVPIGELVNGVTIVREPANDVTYWHVELESHDVLLAEGLGCESYMDAGNRAFFGREYGRLQEIDSARVAESLTGYARPFVDNGPIVEAIRQRLDARAAARELWFDRRATAPFARNKAADGGQSLKWTPISNARPMASVWA